MKNVERAAGAVSTSPPAPPLNSASAPTMPAVPPPPHPRPKQGHPLPPLNIGDAAVAESRNIANTITVLTPRMRDQMLPIGDREANDRTALAQAALILQKLVEPILSPPTPERRERSGDAPQNAARYSQDGSLPPRLLATSQPNQRNRGGSIVAKAAGGTGLPPLHPLKERKAPTPERYDVPPPLLHPFREQNAGNRK